MEDASVTLNGHGEGNFKQPDTAQKQHVFTTKVFVQMGQKDVENDEPFLKDAISIVQKDVVNGKVIGEESVNKSWKLISEDEVVVVSKTSTAFHSELLLEQEGPGGETKETDGSTVESLLLNIETVIDDGLIYGTHEPANDKREVLDEDAPVVIEKSPVSPNMEIAIEGEDPSDEDWKNARKNDEIGEEVTEDEVAVVEKTPVASSLESDVLIENPDDGGKDDTTTVDSLLANIVSVIDQSPLERAQEPANKNIAEVIEELAPVVEKKSFSLDVEHLMKETDEGSEDGEHVTKQRQSFVEDEVVMVKKTVVVCKVESEILVENPDDEGKHADNATVQSLLNNIESVIDDELPERPQELEDAKKSDALEEDYPVVVKKKPISVNVEQAIDFDVKEDEQDIDPVVETEVVVVEKETRAILESEILVDNEEAKKGDSATVEDLLVTVEKVIDAKPSKRTHESLQEKGKPLAEDSPIVIDKRPAPFDMDQMMEQDEETKEQEKKDPVCETAPIVVEKTAVIVESEMLVDNEEIEEDDSTPVETLLVNIESVVDHTLLETAKEPSEDVVEALEEDSPVVIEKRPALFYIEHPLDEDHEKKDVDEGEPVAEAELVVVEKTPVALESVMLVDNEQSEEDDSTPVEILLHPLDEDLEKKDVDEREPVAEAELVVVEKTPVALESDMLVDNEETKEKDSASVETLLENIKSVIDNTTPDQTEEPASAIKPDVLEEDAPIVIEKRPILLHMEEMPDEINGEGDPKAPVTEGELVVVNKTPAIVELGILVEKEGTEGVEDDNATVESLLVNVESVIDYQLPKEGRERADEMKTEALQEDEPVVIERSPVSLHVNQLLDQDDNQKEHDNSETVEGEHELPKSRELVSEAKLVVINKTPASLESEILIELESPEKDHATVESLLVNIESVIDDTSPEQPKVEDDTQPSESKEPIEETVPRAVEKRKRDSSEMEELFVAQNPEESTEKEGRSQDESSNLVDEVVINVVEKKRVCHEQPSETLENQSSVSEESTSVIVLDIPLVEKTEVVKDSVQETVPPAMERKAAESEEELLQRTDEDEPTEPECRETAILDDLEGETLKSTSYTKLFDKDEGSDDELLRQVLSRKRLSAPEILPEKEKDGSAPLAPSESGILDSKEHVPTAHLSHTREAIPTSALAKADSSEKVKDAEEQSAKGLLEADDEDQIDGKRNRLGKKGLASPQCKCCSLM
ncbi:unnamed protein product [Porites evermanni]|uniref:Uncharacterized protein n=1 Tax=Porites evermanni TaxID=104178 RepID=A0ABN8SQV6_9CNID|nr:unnamed protein product [Porites evermanni]